MNRRDFLKLSAAAGAATFAVPGFAVRGGMYQKALAARQYAVLAPGLSDPVSQPKFVVAVPDALDPTFKYVPDKVNKNKATYTVNVGYRSDHDAGLKRNGASVPTPIFGYGQNGQYTWPGKTFEVQSGDKTEVKWQNNLFGQSHLLPVDTSLHWAYSLPGYEAFAIEADGVPIVAHLHGGHTNFQFDGNPEYFFSPGFGVVGPRWMNPKYNYKNDQPAGNLWYHDHALGITRLNVYAGLAGFYFVRDDQDTGKPDNPLGLPAWPYEKAYAIQDRMFRDTGELFYPAFPGEPFWADFIDDGMGGGAVVENGGDPALVPQPSALAEFFGDHMVVNGVIWPHEDVEPRNYRLRLLNGCDSRFMVIQFVVVAPGVEDPSAGTLLDFYVIGSDQGLGRPDIFAPIDTLVFEPGARYDVVIDFSGHEGQRVIMMNLGGDAPFGGSWVGNGIDEDDLDDLFPDRQTDRIMAFDVIKPLDSNIPDSFVPTAVPIYAGNANPVDRIRKLALFEGADEFGRLQPLLGTAEPATDYLGNPINWPNTQPYIDAGLIGQMEGAIAWHSPTTENPALGDTEIWEIYNATMDAHPVHLHLVNFEILERQEFTADVVPQPVVQHNGVLGSGFRLENIQLGAPIQLGPEYVEHAPKDMVTALPGQVTRIKMTFDKPGRYVWHCHILSHEDHEMMRVLHVGPGAAAAMPAGQMHAAEVDSRDDANAPDRTDSGETIYVPFVSGE